MTDTATVRFQRPALDAKAILARFRSTHARLTPVMRRLDLDWPCTAEIQERLAEYVTDGFTAPVARKGRGRASAAETWPLLHVALVAALEAYDQACDAQDDVRLAIFVDTAISEIARGLSGLALSGPENRVWSAAMGAPLVRWLGGVRASAEISVRVGERHAGEREIAAALAQYSLSKGDVAILKGAQHGE